LQFRENNIHSNPYLRLLRDEVHLHKNKLQKELADLNKEAQDSLENY